MNDKKWSLGLVCFAVFFISASSSDFIIRQVTDADYNSSTDLKTNFGVRSVLRDKLPSSKIITVSNFSVIKERLEPYESSTFDVFGYTWRLVLNVKGNINDGGANHVSLYVRIEETDNLPSDWEVNIDLKLFVENKKLNKYLTVTDGTTKKFNNAKKQWGFGKMIPLSTFYNTNEGYIVQDTCSFGAEIVILNEEEEKLTFISNPPDNIFTWKLFNFNSLKDKLYISDKFLIGDRYWKLASSPKGRGHLGRYGLPLYLSAQGFKPNATATQTWEEAYLRIKNHYNSNHKQSLWSFWYPSVSGVFAGADDLIYFGDLYDESQGYFVNDTVIFEVEMITVSVTNIVPI